MQSNQNQNIEISNSKFQEKKVIIHTMPKRFIGSRVITKGHKGVGVVIIVIGILLMIGAMVALYFFILKPKEKPVVNNFQENIGIVEPINNNTLIESSFNDEPADSNQGAENNNSLEPEITPIDNVKQIDIAELSTSTEMASSSEMSSTDKPINNIKIPALDSDQDGLSDIEELLLDCNINNSDSDGDGYSDIDELMKLYNPAGTGKLIVNPNIEKYTNNSFKYSLYYPNTWLKTNVDGENSILFQAGNNQYIQIIVQNNLSGKGLDDWYKDLMDVTEINGSQRMYKAGWSGIKSPDGLIAYLTNPNQNIIFTISYNTGMDNTLMYSAIFNMMIESLALVN